MRIDAVYRFAGLGVAFSGGWLARDLWVAGEVVEALAIGGVAFVANALIGVMIDHTAPDPWEGFWGVEGDD